MVVSPSLTFLFLAMFTQILLFLSPALFLLFFLSLSSIFTLIYLSQFCLEEEVSHFLPIYDKSEDVFLDNIKY